MIKTHDSQTIGKNWNHGDIQLGYENNCKIWPRELGGKLNPLGIIIPLQLKKEPKSSTRLSAKAAHQARARAPPSPKGEPSSATRPGLKYLARNPSWARYGMVEQVDNLESIRKNFQLLANTEVTQSKLRNSPSISDLT